MEVNYRDGRQRSGYPARGLHVSTCKEDVDLVPVVPESRIVGGDDVTVYTDGRYANSFAEAYIRHYEG